MRRYVMFFLALILVLGVTVPLAACPLCKEAISSPGTDGEEINNAPAAYNASIYLMAGMPYLLLGGVGFLIYRGCQKNAACRRCQQADETGAVEERLPLDSSGC